MSPKNENIKFSVILKDEKKLENEAQLFLSQNNININPEEVKLAYIKDMNCWGLCFKEYSSLYEYL